MQAGASEDSSPGHTTHEIMLDALADYCFSLAFTVGWKRR